MLEVISLIHAGQQHSRLEILDFLKIDISDERQKTRQDLLVAI